MGILSYIKDLFMYNHPSSHSSSMIAQAYGPSNERPTIGLTIGFSYFDTTLGYIIWYNGTDWVNAAGEINPVPESWSPAELLPVYPTDYWYGPESNRFKDNALTIPALLDGDEVASSQDLKGNVNLFKSVSENPTYAPTLRKAAFNGYDALEFYGVLQYSNFVVTEPLASFFIAKQSWAFSVTCEGSADYQTFFQTGIDASNHISLSFDLLLNRLRFVGFSSGSFVINKTTFDLSALGITLPSTTPINVVLTRNNTTDLYHVYVNGTLVYTAGPYNITWQPTKLILMSAGVDAISGRTEGHLIDAFHQEKEWTEEERNNVFTYLSRYQ